MTLSCNTGKRTTISSENPISATPPKRLYRSRKKGSVQEQKEGHGYNKNQGKGDIPVGQKKRWGLKELGKACHINKQPDPHFDVLPVFFRHQIGIHYQTKGQGCQKNINKIQFQTDDPPKDQPLRLIRCKIIGGVFLFVRQGYAKGAQKCKYGHTDLKGPADPVELLFRKGRKNDIHSLIPFRHHK